MNSYLHRLVGPGLLCWGSLAASQSASAPQPFVEELRQQERERILREQQERSVDSRLPTAAKPSSAVLPSSETPCFVIDRLVLEGNQSAAFAWSLAAATSGEGGSYQDSPIGRCLGSEGIDIVLGRVQRAIVDRGYTTTRVMAGPQDLSDRVLRLTVIPGRVSLVRSPDGAMLPTTLRHAIPVRTGDLLNLRDIEQGLENLKRLPTVEADIQIEPSKSQDAQPGDSDLVVHYRQKFPLRTTLSLDDSGTEDAAKNVAIEGGLVSITAATNYDSSSSEHYTRGTSIGITGWHDPGKGIDAKNTDKAEQQSSSLDRTVLNGANVSIKATGADGQGGVLTLAGTTINAPGTLTLSADKLVLDTQTTQTGSSTSSQGGDWAWQKAKGQSSSDQRTNYNQFNVGALATPVNSVQVGLGARDSIAALAQQPGMSWIQQINSAPSLAAKVNWAKVEEAHNNWNYSQQGLTPAAAAVATLVVAYFTAGAASGAGAAAGNAAAVTAGEGAAMAGGGTFLSATGATISTVAGGAVTAGLSALAGQAAVALANNQGDVGGALHDLGSNANVKSLLTAVATGGALAGLNLNPTGLPTEGTGAQKFMAQLGQNLQAGAAKAVIGTAINGGSLEDNLQGSLKTALLDTMAAQGAFKIGTALEPGSMANALAHALAGCAMGAATANGGCGAGAVGAAMGELSASLYDPEATNAQGDTVQFAAVMGGIASALAGGSATDVNLASQAAANTAANNWLATNQRAQMQREINAAKSSLEKLQVFGKWTLTSGKQDVLTASGIGKGLVESGISDVRGLAQFLAHPAEGLNGLKQIISSPEARQQLGDSAFAALDAKIGRMQTALEVGGDQNAEQLGTDLGALIWQVGGAAIGAGPVRKGAEALAAVGISVEAGALAGMKFTATLMRSEATGLGGVVSASEIGVQFNKGIAAQGKPFEAYVQSQLPAGTLDLNLIKTNFKTFDHLTLDGTAISSKTLDTTATTYTQRPGRITTTLKGHIDDMVEFPGDGKDSFTLTDAKITGKVMQLGIPATVTQEQMAAIAQSLQYAESKGIKIVVTKLKP